MARVGWDRDSVVAEAAALCDEVGFDRLTMAALARHLRIAIPSIYAHVEGLEHLRQQVAAISLEELSADIGAAIQGRSRLDAMAGLAKAYRRYASKFPGRYAASQTPPNLDDARHVASVLACAKSVYATLEGYGLAEPATTDAARMLRCSLHGFVILEASGGFAAKRALDSSFEAMVAALDRSFSSWPDVIAKKRGK